MANAKRRREQIAVAVLNVVKFREINATTVLKLEMRCSRR